MRLIILISVCVFINACNTAPAGTKLNNSFSKQQPKIGSSKVFKQDSWAYFLQHLPLINGPVLDYKGNPVPYQQKHVALVNYDVGNQDLQQCADALMRLRAEYLFGQKRFDDIAFHFVDGKLYSFDDYCKGIKVVEKGNDVAFIKTNPSVPSHENLRKYLNIVYNYASTISLAKELKKTNDFATGTVIIYPGSPGHCFIIVDEATDNAGAKIYKLVEGYSPAQSIYVLSNMIEKDISPWYHLNKGTITTSSCRFIDYQLGSFE